MIGPFDCCTTARSDERAGVAGAGAAALISVGSLVEHAVKSAPTEATRTVRPRSLRVRPAAASFLGAGDPHVVHFAERQSLQVLPLIIFSRFFMKSCPLDQYLCARGRRS